MLNKWLEQEVEQRVSEQLEKERMWRTVARIRDQFEELKGDIDRRLAKLEKRLDDMRDEPVQNQKEDVW